MHLQKNLAFIPLMVGKQGLSELKNVKIIYNMSHMAAFKDMNGSVTMKCLNNFIVTVEKYVSLEDNYKLRNSVKHGSFRILLCSDVLVTTDHLLHL